LGLKARFSGCLRLAALAAGLVISAAQADDKPAPSLTVIIEDGEVLFQGAALDLDQLKTQLAATGRQKERIYFRMGPHAKTAYTERVIAAIKAAGFTDIAVLPPPGLGKKDPEPPT
jgi:biopolymer transport protein ExbD